MRLAGPGAGRVRTIHGFGCGGACVPNWRGWRSRGNTGPVPGRRAFRGPRFMIDSPIHNFRQYFSDELLSEVVDPVM